MSDRVERLAAQLARRLDIAAHALDSVAESAGRMHAAAEQMPAGKDAALLAIFAAVVRDSCRNSAAMRRRESKMSGTVAETAGRWKEGSP